ncbi:MAG: DUF3786 domain-containing protein [Proteobacteria bacterium]|nr:DUF3786 domain-containing protein [Pseudomonadota bacterium]
MKSNIPKYEQKNYEISKERALQEILKKNIDIIIKNTGATLESNNVISFNFYKYQVKFDINNHDLIIPDAIRTKSTEGLILHYIAYAKGNIPSNNWIQFYQIKDATLYLPVFQKRTINIINKAVKSPEQFFQKALNLGAEEIDFVASARAFKFYAFPLFPLLIVYYEGDDEIPSEMRFMFDSNCIDNLPAEDIVISSQFLSLQFFKA